MIKPRVAGLYAITPEHWSHQALLDSASAVLEAGVKWLQYRDKTARLDSAIALAQLCQQHGAHFVMNDKPELVQQIQQQVAVAACHLGKDDMPVNEARLYLGQKCIIGASCYNSVERAQHMVQLGADYVAFGSMYASLTKPHAPGASLDVLVQAQRLGVPVVAIGGIGLKHIPELIQHGADAVAVVSSLFGEKPNPTQAHTMALNMLACFESTTS